MKIIKLKEDHYIQVDDSEIKEGDWLLDMTDNTIWDCHKDMPNSLFPECKKITHSTQPLERYINIRTQEDRDNGVLPSVLMVKQDDLTLLSLSEVKELIGEVDVEKKAESYAKDGLVLDTPYANGLFYGYIKGYNQALEDNKEKKYTEEDMRKAYMVGKHGGVTQTYYEFDEYIQQLQPKTEWEVEIVDGKLKLK